jgi:hypothetical protein
LYLKIYYDACGAGIAQLVIGTDCRLDGQRFGSQQSRIFFCTPQHPDWLWVPSIQHPVQWVLGALSPEVEQPEREADHLLPSSAEVKNSGAVPPVPDTLSSMVPILKVQMWDNSHLFPTSTSVCVSISDDYFWNFVYHSLG